MCTRPEIILSFVSRPPYNSSYWQFRHGILWFLLLPLRSIKHSGCEQDLIPYPVSFNHLIVYSVATCLCFGVCRFISGEICFTLLNSWPTCYYYIAPAIPLPVEVAPPCLTLLLLPPLLVGLSFFFRQKVTFFNPASTLFFFHPDLIQKRKENSRDQRKKKKNRLRHH